MLFLLDTNAISDFVGEHPVIEAHLVQLAPEDSVATCTIVRGEILFGIERLPYGKRRKELQVKTQRTLGGLLCYPIPESAADRYARVKQ